jgi:HK97 family phage major capsid protein
MSLRQLLERRARIAAEMREMVEGAGDDGALTDEQKAAFDKLKAALAELEGAIQRRALVDEADRRMAGQPVAGSGDPNLDREMRSFSVVRALAHGAGLGVDAGRERELSAELARRSGRPFQGIAVPLSVLRQPIEQRVITTTAPSGGPGGNLIQTTLDGGQYIDLLRAALVIRGLGARILSDLTGNLDMPRLKAAATTGWVAENTALGTTDQQFDKVSLRPKHAGAIVELSRNMLMQTSPDVEQLVRADLAEVLARALDGAAISGTGASNDPTGILATSGIGNVAVGTNGGALTYDLVADLWGAVADANALGQAMSFLGNTKVKRAASKLKDSQARPYGLDVVFQGEQQAWSNLVPSNLTKGTGTNLSALIYGNFSDLVIGLWSELDILVNPFEATAFSKGNVQVRAMMTVDIAVRHPESFAAIKDIAA